MDQNKNRMPPGQQLAAVGKWPIIGERFPRLSDRPWSLDVFGKVNQSRSFSLGDLSHFPQITRTFDIHCVTRWSKLDVAVTGVLLADILEITSPTNEAKFVSFISRSERNHSSSLPLNAALELKTILATHVDGQPLPLEHGGPIRNFVPSRYFYKSVKWLDRIELLAQDRLGFWEAESGYHNNADPWLEERYMAPTIDRRTAAALIECRDFSGRDLRSIDCSNRDLAALNACRARLRDGNFRDTNLENADFSGANLSNAHFENANLQSVNFTGADLEGANFAGADLTGANLSDASLIGATFFNSNPVLAARINRQTIIPDSILTSLTPDQFEFVFQAKKISI